MTKSIAARRIQLYKSDGTAVGAPGNATALVNGTTYYGELPVGPEGTSVQLAWDAAIIVTWSFETSNHPEASSFETTAGVWSSEDATLTPIVVAGGSAASQMVHIIEQMAGRLRLKATVGGTGGVATAVAQGGGYH